MNMTFLSDMMLKVDNKSKGCQLTVEVRISNYSFVCLFALFLFLFVCFVLFCFFLKPTDKSSAKYIYQKWNSSSKNT